MLQNTISNWIGLVVVGLVSFALTPLLLHALGTVNFGIWIVVGSFVDYSGLLDFGIRTAFFRTLPYPSRVWSPSWMTTAFGISIIRTSSKSLQGLEMTIQTSEPHGGQPDYLVNQATNDFWGDNAFAPGAFWIGNQFLPADRGVELSASACPTTWSML